MDFKKRKIKRITHACNYCKLKRTKCSGDCPCNNCKTKNIKCIYSESKKRDNFTNACNYLYDGIPLDTPIMNEEESIFDILINYDLLNNFFKYTTIELIPFFNYEYIKNRINNRVIHFSVLFGLYALSELVRPYGDYNIVLKFKAISLDFIELTRIKQRINDIQINEAFYILSIIEKGGLKCYFYSKCALKIFLRFNVYNMYVSEYKNKEDEKNKREYISKVYNNIIVVHIVSQINNGLIENVELTEPQEEVYSNMLLESNDNFSFSKINTVKMPEENIKVFETLPKLILMKKLNSNKIFMENIKINNYTGKFDINDLLSLKCYGKNIINEASMKSLNFNIGMNYRSKWLSIYTDCISIFRNTLFLYSNMNNKLLKLDASLLIKEEMGLNYIINNLPYDLRYSNKIYHTDPPTLFLYKLFILKNVISKCIDCLLTYYVFLARLSMKKVISTNKYYFNEFSSAMALYEVGIVFLSKYVANHGIDDYGDNLINFKTNIDELKDRLKMSVSNDNWYIGKQYLSDTQKIQISNIINTENQSPIDKNHKNSKNISQNINFDKYKNQNNYDNDNLNNCCCNSDENNTKENLIEILKFLKYFYNISEYVPKNCIILRSHDDINNFLFTDNSSTPSYQFFYNELIKIGSYMKEVNIYVQNFKNLINKANYSIKHGIDSFENDVLFKGYFF
ncbi:hypothetical protein H8356DRAFT_920920 [Neocallimastix lanati (nom. inval.)]|uniref:Zn(2)-C6 fungal-type domain-containing protein n=1 Tax=Neocallimastix californiae TaxID=1754190 RepID=A0A1Y1ZBL1_9FUNG|nr:hypothetical protein H8356DRAFT_920920 [Neocallimastix sp. JGI-2020a]ORY07576.1 hypothetical protein LY90DRAFT_519114 [Neocallimastix californiae]|eukprot:ORY07576.1 hypothetical protein LY90DRAFT_519114 [Neocallimastix californiae]